MDELDSKLDEPMLEVETGSRFQEGVTGLNALEEVCCAFNDVDAGVVPKVVEKGIMGNESVSNPLLGGIWGLKRHAEVDPPEILERVPPPNVCAVENCAVVDGRTPVGITSEEAIV